MTTLAWSTRIEPRIGDAEREQVVTGLAELADKSLAELSRLAGEVKLDALLEASSGGGGLKTTWYNHTP